MAAGHCRHFLRSKIAEIKRQRDNIIYLFVKAIKKLNVAECGKVTQRRRAGD